MEKVFRHPIVNNLIRPRLRNAILLALGMLLSGCPAKKTSPESEAQPKSESPGPQKVVIKGSNTIGEELAPRLIAEYKKDHPSAAFDLETKGSASGFWGLIAGVCDIAAASRGMIKDEEQQAQVRNIEMNDHMIGSYCVAIVVNDNN